MHFHPDVGSAGSNCLVAAATGADATGRVTRLLVVTLKPARCLATPDALTDATSDVATTPAGGASGLTTPEDDMSHHHYDPALEAELDHRRATLQHDAAQQQLARLVGRAARAAATRGRPARPARDRAGRTVTGHARA
jgi:hypothetical protein